MFKRIKRSAIRFITLMGFMAIMTGLLGLSPAQAAEGEITAHFEVVSVADANAAAKAKAVALGQVDVTAKTLLEEERASMPVDLIEKKWRAPTREQIAGFGTLVHSREAAQAALREQINTYNGIVNDARVTVAKLRVKLNHADTRSEKRKFQKRLTKAKMHLRSIYLDAEWRYRPLIGMDAGCFLNTGRNGNMHLNPFAECVDGDKKQIWFGYDPVENLIRVVAVLNTDGSLVRGCLNVAGFEIPENTPPAEMFMVVESLVKLWLRVFVDVSVTATVTVRGELRRDGVVCDSAEETVTKTRTETEERTVQAKSVEEAFAFGEEVVRADVSVKESIKAKVATDALVEIRTTMNLSCPGQEAPSPAFAQFREINDVYVNATTEHCVTVDFPEGHSGTVFWTANKGSFAVPQKSAQDMVQVCSTYKAPSEVPASGTDTITVTATDSVTGKSVTKTTDPFVIKAMPATP